MLRMVKANPSILTQAFNIPQNMNDPSQIVQHLLNTNQVTQDQVNSNVNKVMNMGNNPMFRGFK